MITRLIISVLALGVAIGATFGSSTAHAQRDRGSAPGCESMRSVRALIDFSDADRDLRKNVREAYRALCSELTSGEGSSVYYRNGKLATNYARREGASWYYPNGQLITHYAGREGSSWYFPNGQLVTHYMGREGASWYYPNGQLLTHYYGRDGSSWYYENGQLITHYAGREGASWYYKNGQLLTHYMGREGATWYYENGSQWMSRGPAIPAERLLYPHIVLSRFLRDNNGNWD